MVLHQDLAPHLFSPGRKAAVGRLLSGQATPGCQGALQAEQNSRAHTAHCTSWGRGGVAASVSWHTAWQVEEGHHVRHGSSSTSGGEPQRVRERAMAIGRCVFLCAACVCVSVCVYRKYVFSYSYTLCCS